MAQKRLIAGLLWSLTSSALKASTRVPTQITCKLLKSVPAAGARVSAFLHSFYLLTFDASHRCLPSQGARIIAMSFNPSTLFFLLPYCPFRVAPRAARGAQYSPDSRTVNALSSSFFEWGRKPPFPLSRVCQNMTRNKA